MREQCKLCLARRCGCSSSGALSGLQAAWLKASRLRRRGANTSADSGTTRGRIPLIPAGLAARNLSSIDSGYMGWSVQ